MSKSVLLRSALVAGAGLALFTAVAGRASASTVLFADSFNNPNGTALDGKAADVGGPWVGVVDNAAPNNLQVQNQTVSTVGGARVFYAPFTQSLGAGQSLTMSFTATLDSFAGFSGLSLYSGFTSGANPGTENIFVGAPSNATTFGAVNSATGTTISSTDSAVPAAIVFNYDYDSGAASLTVNGTPAGTAAFTPDIAADALRLANNNGGDIAIQNVSVTATPEPASLGLLGVAAAGLLRTRRRRV